MFSQILSSKLGYIKFYKLISLANHSIGEELNCTFSWSMQKQASRYLVFSKFARHMNASGASIFKRSMAVRNDIPCTFKTELKYILNNYVNLPL